MANPSNPHDKFFRAAMHNAALSQAFFKHYLPVEVRDALNLNSIKLENSTYIDDNLQETISDLVFNCHYNEDLGKGEAKISLLVEHQSTPDRFMAFRVYHYMFNMLYTLLKGRNKTQAKDKLPVIYALVFYHGKQTPYPYSMRLADCFDDPLNLMSNMFNTPIPLVDINQANDDELKQQQLLGIMTGALKYSRDNDVRPYLQWLMETLNSMDLNDYLALKFVRTVLNYILSVGNTTDVKLFIKGGQKLPKPVRGEFMTIAEQLRAMGAEEAREEARAEVDAAKEEANAAKEELNATKSAIAVDLLKEGVEPEFIARIAKLDLAMVLQLKAQLNKNV